MRIRFILFLLMMLPMCFFSDIVYGEKCAVFFFEYDHADTAEEGSDETSAINFSTNYLETSYDKFYWLVNEDATRDNFAATIQEAVNQYDVVDVYIHAHGGMQFFRGHFDDRITVDDILSFGTFDNIENLRLVYVGSCHGFDLTDEFVEIGADVSIGCDTKMVNYPFYTLFLYHFAKLNQTAGQSCQLSDIKPNEKFRVSGDESVRMEE